VLAPVCASLIAIVACSALHFFSNTNLVAVVLRHGHLLSRLGTHYLCGSSEGLDNGLEVEVIDKEEEVGKGKAGKTEDDRSEVG
jgi:hypothetical protein